MRFFLIKILRGDFGQQFKAGAEGRESVLGRIRAAALGRFFYLNVL